MSYLTTVMMHFVGKPSAASRTLRKLGLRIESVKIAIDPNAEPTYSYKLKKSYPVPSRIEECEFFPHC